MSHPILVVDLPSVKWRTSGPSTGDVWLVFGTVEVPARGWNDFALVILAAWLDALTRLLATQSAHERVLFMEGPYSVELTRLETGAFHLLALERRATQLGTIEVDETPLVDESVAAAESILEASARAHHRSSDVEALEAALAALREARRSLPR